MRISLALGLIVLGVAFGCRNDFPPTPVPIAGIVKVVEPRSAASFSGAIPGVGGGIADQTTPDGGTAAPDGGAFDGGTRRDGGYPDGGEQRPLR